MKNDWKYLEKSSSHTNGHTYDLAKENILFVDMCNNVSKKFEKNYWDKYYNTYYLYYWSLNI